MSTLRAALFASKVGLAPDHPKGGLPTATIRDVPLFDEGDWSGSDGRKRYRPEDIDALIYHTNVVRPELRPRVKVTHDDNHPLNRLDIRLGDLGPLRRKGTMVFADFHRVPMALAKVIQAGGWSVISSEIRRRYEDAKGTVHPIVLDAAAVLGLTHPAVKSLGDIPTKLEQGGQAAIEAFARITQELYGEESEVVTHADGAVVTFELRFVNDDDEPEDDMKQPRILFDRKDDPAEGKPAGGGGGGAETVTREQYDAAVQAQKDAEARADQAKADAKSAKEKADAATARVDKFEARATRSDATAFAEKVIKKITPANRGRVIEVLAHLDRHEGDTKIEFSETFGEGDDAKTTKVEGSPAALLREVFESLPDVIDTDEHGRVPTDDDEDPVPAHFAAGGKKGKASDKDVDKFADEFAKRHGLVEAGKE